MKDRKKMERTGIDWDDVHRRLERVNEALAEGLRVDEAEKRRILKRRADLFAQPAAEEAGERIEIVEFLLSFEKYGIESNYVREVCPLTEFTPVPCTPPFVLGIMNVRGEILSIVDMRRFFDLPERGLTELNRVLILRSDQMEFGILADEIAGIRTVAVEALLAPPPTFTGHRREYCKGVASGTAILDGQRIMSDERLIINEFV